ncbi:MULTISPECIES: hypothetical protein [Pseudomonas syringae group]|uniref:SLOG domain-containing protein n=1 Tax=Pseudomonas syringae group TaxID=136849 RepID=UPI0013030E04|nr:MULTISPECIES: hypothetical protein [Pseudomonas syringae group]MCF5199889.1 hypothetical protein [Pseudomonas syringae]MCF5209308.1 hypothetical protein [Pseudomonas syringae]MCF5214947.1 hypothetical protein [Pseudomonas syringae]MCF5218373.1 hypothetical protein [Pseudomonas syringae]MCF5268004.1 hypothetical protein [Pseudomonas syringae]
MSSIFLSASVPDIDSPYYKRCDPVLIQAALRSFLFTVIGRKHLVFGGHPSISPLILAICEDLGITNQNAVTIFQSKHFSGVIPEDNRKFANFIETPVGNDLDQSLSIMRKQMFTNYRYDAAVFIGGKEGIVTEYEIFKRLCPNAKILALKSPGGAAAEIQKMPANEDDELLDYVRVFSSGLELHHKLDRKPTAPKRRGRDKPSLGM